MRSIRAVIALIAVLVVVVPSVGNGPESPADAQLERDALEQGAFLYETYCSTCHGKKGKGDGEAARARDLRPADLTRLSRNNGGVFPRERVLRTIDGREQMAGHDGRRMPIWGLTLQDSQSDANQEAEIQRKLRQLVAFLETLQR